MILILGAPEEQHAAFIFQKIKDRGGEAVYFDTRRFPSETQLAFEPGQPVRGFFQESPSAKRYPLSEIQSVYWRYFMGIEIPGVEDTFLHEMAYREINSTIGALFRTLDCLWVNGVEAIEQHRYKPHQLQLLSSHGLRIPHTLITNDGEAVTAFYEQMNRQVIFKPVSGGAHTSLLSEADLKPERLKELAKSPVQFQEMIPGVDIRVYLVGDELFAAEIQSQTLDFRDDPKAPIQPITLPDSVAADCRLLAKLYGLVFAGIDIRRTPAGEYVFIEGNPSPMFIHFEKVSGYPISDRLVGLLMGQAF